jgi:hypothetical protein
MSDDEEMEQFEMNDEDIERMFNPGGFRRKKQTKEEAMLGIWASSGRDGGDNSSDEDDDEFSYRNQFKKKNTGSVDFVPSSKKIIKPNDFKKKDESDDEENQKKTDDLDISDEDDYDNKKSHKV